MAGIRDRVDPDVIALEGFHEGFGHPVTLRAFDRGEARDQVERQGNLDGLVRGEDRAVVRQPLHRMRRAQGAEALEPMRRVFLLWREAALIHKGAVDLRLHRKG